jgi:hypothetical protein
LLKVNAFKTLKEKKIEKFLKIYKKKDESSDDLPQPVYQMTFSDENEELDIL